MTTYKQFNKNLIEALNYSGDVADIISYISSINGMVNTQESPNRLKWRLDPSYAGAHFSGLSGKILENISIIAKDIAKKTKTTFFNDHVNDFDKKVSFIIRKNSRKVCKLSIKMDDSFITYFNLWAIEERSERGQKPNSISRRTRQPKEKPATVNAYSSEYKILISELGDQGDGDKFYFGLVKYSDIQSDGNQYVAKIDYLDEFIPSTTAYNALQLANSNKSGLSSAELKSLLRGYNAFTVLNSKNLKGFSSWKNKGVSFGIVSPNTEKGLNLSTIIENAKNNTNSGGTSRRTSKPKSGKSGPSGNKGGTSGGSVKRGGYKRASD